MRLCVRLFVLLIVVCSFVGVCAQAEEPNSWRGDLAGPDERGERLSVSGTILDKATGKGLSGVEVYVYETDANGIYGDSPRTPRLKLTLYSRKDGHYEYTAIRPASYPKEKVLAHIHYVVYADGYKEWQGELVFEDDPFLTTEKRAEVEKDPYFLLRPIAKDAKGVWHVVADVGLAK